MLPLLETLQEMRAGPCRVRGWRGVRAAASFRLKDPLRQWGAELEDIAI